MLDWKNSLYLKAFRDGKSTTSFVIFSNGLTFSSLGREKTQPNPNQTNQKNTSLPPDLHDFQSECLWI